MFPRHLKFVSYLSFFILEWLTVNVSEIMPAEQMNALRVEETLHARSFPDWSLFEFSPDGRWLVYVVQDEQRMNSNGKKVGPAGTIPSYGKGTDIWILDLQTGEARNLTNERGNNWNPKWSPDGHCLAFLSDRDGSGNARLWVWDGVKNNLRRVSEADLKQWDPIEWDPNSSRVLVTAMPPSTSPDASARPVQPTAEGRDTAAGNVRTTVVVYESNGIKRGIEGPSSSDPWDLNDSLRSLAWLDILTGQTTLLVRNRRIQTYRLSPNGLSVAYTVPQRFQNPPSQQILFDLVVLTIATMKERTVAKDIPLWFEGDFSWSPNSTLLTYRTGGPDQKLLHDCYIVSGAGGLPRNVTHFSEPQQSSPYLSKVSWWDKDGTNIYFIDDGALWKASFRQDRPRLLAQIAHHRMGWRSFPQSKTSLEAIDEGTAVLAVAQDTEGRQEGFYKINLNDGGVTKLLERGQCYTCGNAWLPYAITPGRHGVAYVAEDAQHGYDLWLSDTAFKVPHRLTRLNPQLDKYRLGSAQLIDWLSDDGERLQGALLLPSDYREGKRYPLITAVWGGKQLSKAFDRFGFIWTKTGEKFTDFNMQLLATRGYAVLLPDSPWRDGHPMAGLAKTVLPGVNKVIEMGIADPNRLGLMGLNDKDGIDDVLALIVQTPRFRAAVDLGGAGDLMSLYQELSKTQATSEINSLERLLGGPPWQLPERYRENSPFLYLNKVETPLLVLRGAQDGSRLKFFGDQTFVALQRLGKNVQYARYENDDHFPGGCPKRLDPSNRILAWFDRYLGRSPK